MPLPPKKVPTPPTGSPNWGVMILMLVITGILVLAFTFDGTMNAPARTITLDAFRQDYREGLVVLTQPKDFPIEVVSSDGSSESTLTAYLYKKKPEFPVGEFYMPFTDSDTVRTLCNRFGITAGQQESPEPELGGRERVWSTDEFARMGEEGRIIVAPSAPVIYENGNSGVILGSYRKNPEKKVALKDVEPVRVTFNRVFQGEAVRELLGNNATYSVESNTWSVLLINCLPVVLLVALFVFFFRSQNGGPGGAMKFGRSRARLLDPSKNRVTFNDVAGVSEAKEEVWEIVEFLRNPKKFRNLGGTIPKGVLMVGPPGTGKTLLARAIAGEAEVPFYTISGSDFVEMFVGVGASRVRDMFAEAKKNSPCLIFIDEIDAVGRHRGHGVGGGHDEREQTLNALLVEMDGFTANENVIVIAATNRVDVLDPALLRPGRFDRQVTVNLPDAAGREQILKVHARKIKLAEGVDLAPIARATTGFSGAELANLVNESALIAARRNAPAVTQADMEEAREKVRWGRERRSLEISEKEKRNTAVHEAGHAICLLKTALKKSLPLHKVTIIPRGPALGVTMMLPEEDKHSEYESEMLDYIVMAMGGRCAEQVVFGDISGGASADIRQATALARKMVCVYGMSPKLGPVEYSSGAHSEVFLARDMVQGRSFSEHTAQIIDEEVQRLVTENYQRALDILTGNKERLLLIADKLIEFETLSGKQVAELLETGEMSDPPVRELPPELPPVPEASEEQPEPTEAPAAPETTPAPAADEESH
ncbi:MAG: ATP-dependent zinc metalloprotease FtsH [Akkermansia sp.]|nr:ATP-dependent zinc metalloprotease FtsH [Akkermansia sp.]